MVLQDDEPILQQPRQIKYWLRCLKTLLPSAYISHDSQRMTFAFFTLSALDLLSAFDKHVSATEKNDYVDWIYRCQHTEGGFKGFTGATTRQNHPWDPANLAATFFALASLMVLGDDFARVKVESCLIWIGRLQREDGSFGEAIGKGGVIEGSGDIRYCYLAAAVRFILRRSCFQAETQDIDVENLARYVRSSITYEGGIGKSPFQEAHAGWTYCGIGVFRLLGRLPLASPVSTESMERVSSDIPVNNILHWLVSRQTSFISKDSDDDESEADEGDDNPAAAGPPSFQKQRSFPAASLADSNSLNDLDVRGSDCAGFNGRCNKIADSCYAFWAGASLAMLDHMELQDVEASRRYLLQKAQHMIGGFGKLAGDPPDILHSYLGLAALAIMKHPELGDIDPTLCISLRAYRLFEDRFPRR